LQGRWRNANPDWKMLAILNAVIHGKYLSKASLQMMLNVVEIMASKK